MIQIALHRKLALTGALIATLSLAGAAAADSPPSSTHASATAVKAVANAGPNGPDVNHDSQDAHAAAVSAAAQSDTVGGKNQNHGGYVSCIARGGSDCTSTTPTLPSHPEGAGTHTGTDESSTP